MNKTELMQVRDALSINRVMAKDSDGNYTREVTPKVITDAIALCESELARVVEPVAPEIESVLEKWEKWALSTELDGRNHDLVDALAEIRASRNVAEKSLVKVLQACNEYLPPDGIDAKACISKILAIVDPWPLTATPQAAAQPSQAVLKQAYQALDLAQALLEKSYHHKTILDAYKALREVAKGANHA